MTRMEDLETSILVGMLAECTQKFTHLFRLHRGLINDPEYSKCKEMIKQIIEELDRRRNLPKRQEDQPVQIARSPLSQ